MNILQLAPRLPYPLTDGGKVGIFNITKHLAMRGHRITMLTFDQEGHQNIDQINEVCKLVTVREKTNDSIYGGILNLFSNEPYKISKYCTSKYTSTLRQLLKSDSYDVVHVDHLHMAHYGIICKYITGLPIVLREHNVESTIVERFVQTIKNPMLRPYLYSQLKRMQCYEAKQTAEFDMCCMITKEDMDRLYKLNHSARMCIIPGGIESSYFSEGISTAKIPHSICFFGTYDWIANKDGIHWFLDDVFQKILDRIPDTKLFLVGNNIPSKLIDRFSNNIVLRGYVPNLKEELSRYEISMAPIRIGGGMRLKILESFAMKIPVVATSIGCEGIQAVDTEHLLIGNSSDEFADQTVRLLNDKELRNRIINNAYALADEKYRWERIAEQFENLYHEVISKNNPSKKDGINVVNKNPSIPLH